MNSKAIGGMLIAGTLVLGGGSALAALLPSRAQRDTSEARPPARSQVNDPHSLRPSNVPALTVVYSVKNGDTLSDVARWFENHGLGSVWLANQATLQSETHLLYPGERLIVADGIVTIEPPAT